MFDFWLDSFSFLGMKLIIPNIMNDIYVIIFRVRLIVSLLVFPKIPPNIIASPWLNNEPNATPSSIGIVLVFAENDNTSNCVLSPNSDMKISKNAMKNGYIYSKLTTLLCMLINNYALKIIICSMCKFFVN